MYRIMGYKPTPVDVNRHHPEDVPEEIVIYETDDEAEAVKIMSAGGYIDSNDVYYPASRLVNTDVAAEYAKPSVKKTSIDPKKTSTDAKKIAGKTEATPLRKGKM